MTGPWVPTTSSSQCPRLLLPSIHSSLRLPRVPGHSEVRTSAAATLQEQRLYCGLTLSANPPLLPSIPREKQNGAMLGTVQNMRSQTAFNPLFQRTFISRGVKKKKVNSILIHACPCCSASKVVSPSPPTAGRAPRSLLVCSCLRTRGRMPLACRWIH